MTRPTLPGESSDADYALCREAAKTIHKAHPFVRGRLPLEMTADQHALRQAYLSLALRASGDRFANLADYDQRLALAREWVERARAAEAAAKPKRQPKPPAEAKAAEAEDQPLPFGP